MTFLRSSVLVLVISLPCQFAFAASADQLLQEASALDAAGKVGEALAKLEYAYSQSPNDATVIYNLAVLRDKSGKRAKAIEAYEEFLVISPASPDVPAIRSRIAKLRAAGLVIPAAAKKHILNGQSFVREERFVEAEREFLGASRLVPGWLVPHYNLGIVYEKQNRKSEALAAFERYLPIASAEESAALTATIGQLRASVESEMRAAAQETDLAKQRAEAEVAVELARLEAQKLERERAAQAARDERERIASVAASGQRQREQAEVEARVRLLKAKDYQAAGDLAAAARELQAAVQVNALFLEGWRLLAEVREAQTSWKEAADAWRQCLRLDSSSGRDETLSRIAGAELKQAERDKADAAERERVRLAQEEATLQVARADTAARAREPQRLLVVTEVADVKYRVRASSAGGELNCEGAVTAEKPPCELAIVPGRAKVTVTGTADFEQDIEVPIGTNVLHIASTKRRLINGAYGRAGLGLVGVSALAMAGSFVVPRTRETPFHDDGNARELNPEYRSLVQGGAGLALAGVTAIIVDQLRASQNPKVWINRAPPQRASVGFYVGADEVEVAASVRF